jgi:hypothetical protein
MKVVEKIEQNKETTGWSIVGLIIALLSSHDLIVQAIVAILIPIVAWTLLYFWKREISYRFPPKEPKRLPKEDLDDLLP